MIVTGSCEGEEDNSPATARSASSARVKHWASVLEALTAPSFTTVKPRILPPAQIDQSLKKVNGRASFLGKLAQTLCFGLRFGELAQVLEVLTVEKYAADQLIAGMFLFENHELSSPHRANFFVRHCRCLKTADKKAMALEYVIYCLKRSEHAHLRTFFQEHLRVHRKMIRKSERVDHILRGYLGVLDYIEWLTLANGQTSSMASEENDTGEVATGADAYQGLTSAARAMDHFRMLLDHEGPFDIFVVKLIHMLEFYGHLDEAESALERYLDNNPESLNAHVYLYTFLKNHNLRLEEQVDILHVSSLSACQMPHNSAARVTRFIATLEPLLIHGMYRGVDIPVGDSSRYRTSSGSATNLHVGLLIYVVVGRKERELLACLKRLWRERCGYWRPYHFAVHPQPSGCPDVWICKATLLRTLGVDATLFLPLLQTKDTYRQSKGSCQSWGRAQLRATEPAQKGYCDSPTPRAS
ncbi:unnamed protein product [Ixodes hexagonus]